MEDNCRVLGSLNAKITTCEVCKKNFKYKSQLIVQKRTHTTCEKSFTQKCQLTFHMLVHSGKKDFQCFVCLIEFARIFVLKQHMVTHTKDNDFKYKICNKNFSRKESVRHMLVHT